MLENQAGQPSFKAMRRRAAEHPIEKIGAKLRAMMPWIAKNKLVDRTVSRASASERKLIRNPVFFGKSKKTGFRVRAARAPE
jgi:hypothetical protein